MADEITLTIRFDVTNGNYAPGAINVNSLQIDQAAAGATEGIQNIGTTEETVSAGGLSTQGWLFLRNLDATNFISIGSATGEYLVKMKATEPAVFRITSGKTLYAKADTAACNLYYRWLED